MVSGAVYVVDEMGTTEIESIELMVDSLKLGKVKRLDGKELQLANPEEVKRLTIIEEVVDSLPPNLRVQVADGLSVEANSQLDAMLAEAKITREEE
jgi:hypothetical protein